MLVKVRKQKERRKDCDKDSSKIESKNRAADVSVSLQMEDIVRFCGSVLLWLMLATIGEVPHLLQF